MAAPRRRRDTDTDESDAFPQTALVCLFCTAPDPDARSTHQLRILKGYGLEKLRAHLTEQYVTFRDPGKGRQDSVDAIMLWATNLLQQYAGMVHPATGAPMPWWEARQWLMDNRDASASGAYTHAPAAYRQAHPLPIDPSEEDPLALS